MASHRFVAVVGARVLPEVWAPQVAAVVRFFVDRAWGIGTGGARGADQYALEAAVATGRPACARSVVFLPGMVGGARTAALTAFQALGGRVVAGSGEGRAALLARSRRLARESSGVVALLWGPARGSVFTVREAIGAGKPAAVVLAGGDAELPRFTGGQWVACAIGPVAAYRWVPEAGDPDEPEQKLTGLGRIFAVPEGEPVHALLDHISTLSQGERLWFEQGIVAGDTVLIPHEVLTDTPAFLTVPRLMRGFRCTAHEAAGLAELFLALDARRDIVAHYEAEARRWGVVAIIENLVHLVARLEISAACSDTDALAEAECLGEWAEDVAEDGHLAALPVHDGGGEVALLAWHALGPVHTEIAICPVCGARYCPDDEAVELPRCSACGARDEWEARQGARFVALMAEIDGCPSLTDLAALGKRLYTLALPHDQAGVAWAHYQLRKVALEAVVTLGAAARALIARIEASSERALPRLRRAVPPAARRRGGHVAGVAARVAGVPGAAATRRVGRRRHGAPAGARNDATDRRSLAGPVTYLPGAREPLPRGRS